MISDIFNAFRKYPLLQVKIITTMSEFTGVSVSSALHVHK